MKELLIKIWTKFWHSFWKICNLEIRDVSFVDLIILSFIGAVLVHIGCIIYVKAKKHPIYFSTELIIILLISYVNFIVQVSILNREPGSQLRVFDPKLLWINSTMDQNMTNLLNVILFIPFGTLLAGILVNKSRIKRTCIVIISCFFISLLIEGLQYSTRRGYFEIDDIQANILGGLCGSIFVSFCLSIGGLLYKKNTEEWE